MRNLKERKLDCNRAAGLGIDGASVMTGWRNGVAAKWRALVGFIICVHCLCHRLALSGKDTAEATSMMKQLFIPVMEKLLAYYSRSTSRTSSLYRQQLGAGVPPLRIISYSATRY